MGEDYHGRYFYLGNLLIQFSDFPTGTFPASTAAGNSYTMNYPISYDVMPYSVMVCGVKQETNNFPVSITLRSFTSASFYFEISTDAGGVSFFVIGQRPNSV